MSGHPMPGDVNAPAYPCMLVLQNVVQKALQSRDASRPADQARMQADRKHFWRVEPARVAFAIERIERIAQVIKELRAAIEALHGGEAHVVAVQCVRHNQVWLG